MRPMRRRLTPRARAEPRTTRHTLCVRELGFREVAIDSRIEAVPFYEKLGYAPVDAAVVRSGSFDCIRMRKHI